MEQVERGIERFYVKFEKEVKKAAKEAEKEQDLNNDRDGTAKWNRETIESARNSKVNTAEKA